MDRIDRLQAHVDALEQQLHGQAAHTRVIKHSRRWWRGLACGVLLVSLVSLPLSSGIAKEEHPEKDNKGLQQRVQQLEVQVKALQATLVAVTFDATTKELIITGANLRIVNGLGRTNCGPEDASIPNCPNGLGNLIVGYNESRGGDGDDVRTGSHNVVVGERNNFSRFGGLVVGLSNEVSGIYASVSGGAGNTASGAFSSVSGGDFNTASAEGASVSGGNVNTASADLTSVSGGLGNTASGVGAWVSGGNGNTASGVGASVNGGSGNTASGDLASVSGGSGNTASGNLASISGGLDNTASGNLASVSGGAGNIASGEAASVSGGGGSPFIFPFPPPNPAPGNIASGALSVVSGGRQNTASGTFAAVSGGLNRTAEGENAWRGGRFFSDE